MPSRTPSERISYTLTLSSLGTMLIAASDTGICAITLGDDPAFLVRDLHTRFPHADLTKQTSKLKSRASVIKRHLQNPKTSWTVPLDVRGTAFQQRVWQALREIPLGKTASYADIAKKIGKPKAMRAVAQACSANHIAIAIPCHRVIRNDGSLSGYCWGVDRKAALLKKEATA
jgi:AraC family transcriptional regulator of adaptative response/methylated-DNA-[protein]-cysteine methyltransferase